MVLAIGAVGTAGWGVYSYRAAKRVEAAKWIQGLFRDFYIEDRFKRVRELLEYEWEDKAGPLLARRLSNREIPPDYWERLALQELDMLLNYFEHVLYLEEERHLSAQDRKALFSYWFEIMGKADRGSLRRYAACFDFERVAKALKAGSEDYVAVYGSLMEGLELPGSPELDEYFVDEGKCDIPGVLYDAGDYPALVLGEGNVTGELFRMKDQVPGDRSAKAFELLDRYERYNPHDLKGSLYHRRLVRLHAPDVDAWTYIYNGDLKDLPQIESGDWRGYRAARNGSQAT
jgi:gamma-glutamylcyclotransferase (GGCT)/AIG2-like uncharacterized protein YtfP